MVRTMRISFLVLGLLGLYTNTSCMSAKLSSCANAVRAGINTITLPSARNVLTSTGNVLRTINKYTPIIALGAVVSISLGAYYAQCRQQQLYNAYNTANNKLNAARQELIACRTWADQWCIPALNMLNVELEILNNPSTWEVYCSNLSIDRVLACVRRLTNRCDCDPTVLLCKLTAESDHAAQAFETYKIAYESWKQAKNNDRYGYQQNHTKEYGYSAVMVPVYLRKIEFLKTLIKIRSNNITQSARTQYRSCSCACAA